MRAAASAAIGGVKVFPDEACVGGPTGKETTVSVLLGDIYGHDNNAVIHTSSHSFACI